MVRVDSYRRCVGCLLTLPSLGWQPAEARDKTDVITLRNGDHVTGSTPDGSRVTVQGPTGDSIEIAPARVTRIAKLESTFWSRIDGSFSVGYNFTKSTDITVISGQFDASYLSLRKDRRQPERRRELIEVTGAGTLDRDQIGFSYQWLLPNRNFWAGLLNLERNEELGIDGRVQLGGGFGRYLYQSPHSEIAAFAGATVNREWVTGNENAQESAEGVLGGTWRIYRLNTPKQSLTAQLVFYPSITESGRYRGKADVSWRQEIIKDFFFNISFYYDYDNQPPGDATVKDDYGIVTSLGYTF